MSRFNGSETLIRKGRTVPGWEISLRRFNNLCATWPASPSITCFYRGTVADVAPAPGTVSWDFSVALWVKVPKATTTNKGLWVVNDAALGFAIVGMYWEYNGGSPNIRVDYGSQMVRHSISTPIPNDGLWHCVVFSSSIANTRTYLRVDNGAIVDSTSTGAPEAPQGGLTNLVTIGYYSHPMLSHQYDMGGVSIDEIAWMTRGIGNVDDFNKLYNSGFPPDLMEADYWIGAASLNIDSFSKWFRFDFDPNNGRTFTSGLVSSATGAGAIANAIIHSSQLGTPVAGALFPSADHETTHQTMPDYAALADAWGNWSKGVTFPAWGTRYALGSGVEVRTDAPGLMPESESGWGYYLQNSWVTLNTQEPFSTPTLETVVVGTGLFDDSLPSFNNDLQAAADGRNFNRRDGLFAKRV